MNRLLGFATIGACAVLMLCAAPSSAAPQKNVKKPTITVTGCVQKGADANSYMLASGSTTYELVGAPAGVNFADHVGHKVSVTGTSVKPKKAAKIETKTGTSTAPSPSGRNFNVKSLKMVATSCS